MPLKPLKQAIKILKTAPLTYEENALEPVMSKETLIYHYDHLAKAYAKKYNKGEGDPEFMKAGWFLHEIFFAQFSAPKDTAPKGDVLELIKIKHDSFDDFKDKFKEQCTKLHGSGWVYLAKNGSIKTIHNHEIRNDIILLVDMWEHSFVLDYEWDKDKYVDNIWKIVDWKKIESSLK